MSTGLDDAKPRYLWLTRHFPYPAHAGDRIYSAKLIEALTEQNCHVTVFCTGESAGETVRLPEGQARRADWVICPQGGGQRMLLFPFSDLPRHALRLSAAGPRQMLRSLLAGQVWDAVMIDYVSMGWALPHLLSEARNAAGRRPTLVYVSHNHESSLRRLACQQSTAVLPIRLAQRVDGARIGTLERRLLKSVDLVTVNTTADQELFKVDAPGQRYCLLVPGYDGPRLAQRQLTMATPRRVVVVGSFDWIVKQQNLTEFLEAAAAPLARHGIGIDIVGSGPARVLDALRRQFPDVAVHGRVEAVEPYIQGARISIVPERTGGGFKHKVLNAVFQRSPVFGMTGSITEVPLVEGRSLRLFPDFPSLVDGIIRGIDDLEGLNELQEAACESCRDRFQWIDRGRTLHQALSGPTRNGREAGPCRR
jgi:polysaccharide biosynthesis protein PslH